jgi:hypothetical protein
MGWKTEESEFQSQKELEIFLLHAIQISVLASLAYYQMGTRGGG